MDSMRTLDTSLPRSPPQNHARRRQKPTGELLQAFKAAALSVTQLYKTAAAEDETARDARDAGYQEALDDLLGFLDQNNLGLNDGEGWQVREWATQRYGSVPSPSGMEGVRLDAEMEEERRAHSTSPVLQHKASLETESRRTSKGEAKGQQTRRMSSSTPPLPASNSTSQSTRQDHHNPAVPRSEVFHFRSSIPYPQHQHQHQHQHRHNNNDIDSADSSSITSNDQTCRSPTAVRLEVMPPSRSTRSHTRHTGHQHQRILERGTSSSSTSMGHGAGSKRKIPLTDFFDISGVGGNGGNYDRDERGGGGKRGRMA